MSRRLYVFCLACLLPLAVLGFSGTRAIAQSDPPGRVGRLNHTEGAVTFLPAGDNEWTEVELNRPITRGDKLWTDKGSRAELQIGSSAVRMDGQTQLEVMALDDQSAQLSVTKGSVYVRVRSLPEGENFEIDTPNLAYRAAYPGDYRIDVDPTRGITRVTIHSGTGAVYGEGGQSLPLGGGQQVTFKARVLAQVTAQESPPQDNFDRWAAERNRREDQSVSARFVPREVVGYQQLDSHGQWTQDPTYGAVWMPAGVKPDWAPYRNGRWEWIGPWGWTWLDDAPWGFATSHYGRWTQVGARWAWVPGRMGLRPLYAPALVAFVGTGKPGVAWFPLGPGEAWQPGYAASALYIGNVNRNMPPVTTSYAYQRKPEALTAISVEDFHRGKPVRAGWVRVAGNMIANAQVVPPPAMPVGRERSMVARAPAQAQAAADIRQVNSAATTASTAPQQPAAAQRDRDTTEQQAKIAQQARLAEQAKAEQAKAAEQLKLTQQAKAAEQAKLAQQAKLAEQAKAEQAKAAEKLKLAQQAKAAEQAKLAQQAKAAEQAKLAQQAKLADQAKAAEQHKVADQRKLAEQQAKSATEQARVQARAAEQARAVELARAADQAQRAAQARLAQQMKAAAAQKPGKAELAKRAEPARREAVARKAEDAKREQLAKREQVALAAAAAAKAQAQAKAEDQAKRAELARRSAAVAKREEQARRVAHAQQVEAARRAADREAQALRDQRVQREAMVARRQADEREQAQRDAWQRQQQAQSEQWRRDQSYWEQQQQRERAARSQPQRPDLRRVTPMQPAEPEVWQRGIPILNPGRTS